MKITTSFRRLVNPLSRLSKFHRDKLSYRRQIGGTKSQIKKIVRKRALVPLASDLRRSRHLTKSERWSDQKLICSG